MLPQTKNVRRWMTLAKSLVALGCAALALPTTTRAGMITNLVDNSTILSFNFSGTGMHDFPVFNQIFSSSFWTLTVEGHTPHLTTFNFYLSGLRHVSGGSAAPTLSITGAYGTPQFNIVTGTHSPGVDTFALSINVSRNEAGTDWGFYSGWFSANHTVTANRAPDGGSTAAMAGLAVVLLAGARRIFRTA